MPITTKKKKIKFLFFSSSSFPIIIFTVIVHEQVDYYLILILVMMLIGAFVVVKYLKYSNILEKNISQYEYLPILLSLKFKWTNSNKDTNTWFGICSIL